MAETDANGATQRWFVYGNYIDEPLMMVAKCLDNTDPINLFAHTLYYVQDALYSTRALVAYKGWVIEEQTAYDVYGNPLTWTSGDADADRDIDSGDWGNFQASYGESKCDPNYNWRCDADNSGGVNFGDTGAFIPPRFSSTPANQQSFFTNPYYFTGRRVDLLDDGNLQLQHNRHRHYDYYTGRWLTHDPLGYVDGMNLYNYGSGNPILAYDPTGLSWEIEPPTDPIEPPPWDEITNMLIQAEKEAKWDFYWWAHLFLPDRWEDPLKRWYYEEPPPVKEYTGSGDPRNRDIINNMGFHQLVGAWVAKNYCGTPLKESEHWSVGENSIHWKFRFPFPHRGGMMAYSYATAFLGSYDADLTEKAKENCMLDIHVVVRNTTHWESACKTFPELGGKWCDWPSHERGAGPFQPSRGGNFEQNYIFDLDNVPICPCRALCDVPLPEVDWDDVIMF